MSLLIVGPSSASIRKSARKRWASEMARGKTGGSYGMNLFNTDTVFTNAYHNTGSYTLNPNLWCSELLPQLSGVVFAKDDCGTDFGSSGNCWHSRYGGVAITKRHVLYCFHAHPHAAGTWGPNPGQTNPTKLRWRDINGTIVDRIQLHQAAAGNSESNIANDNGANTADMCVAVLDSDLPDSIYIPRLMYPFSYPGTERIAVSQEWIAAVDGQQATPASDYPSHNRMMVYISYTESGSIPTGFRYNVWPGDSGTPSFVNINGELILSNLVGAKDLTTGPDPGGWTPVTRINALIGLADTYAKDAGRIAAVTGYTVSVAS